MLEATPSCKGSHKTFALEGKSSQEWFTLAMGGNLGARVFSARQPRMCGADSRREAAGQQELTTPQDLPSPPHRAARRRRLPVPLDD